MLPPAQHSKHLSTMHSCADNQQFPPKSQVGKHKNSIWLYAQKDNKCSNIHKFKSLTHALDWCNQSVWYKHCTQPAAGKHWWKCVKAFSERVNHSTQRVMQMTAINAYCIIWVQPSITQFHKRTVLLFRICVWLWFSHSPKKKQIRQCNSTVNVTVQTYTPVLEASNYR